MRSVAAALSMLLLSACIAVDLRTPAQPRGAAAEVRAPPAPPEPTPAAASFGYQGAHPVPAGGWCDLVVLHEHDFAPIAELAWTSPSPGVFVFMGPPPAAPPAPPAPVVAPVDAGRTMEAIETVGEAAKVVGKVGKAIGVGAYKFIKSNKNLDGSGGRSTHSHNKSSGHHGGGHHGGGHH